MERTYLDYNATALIRPDVLTLVTQVMGEVGNVSSVHDFGRRARHYVEQARRQVAQLCAVQEDQVVFTSGATESINTVLGGYRDKPCLISSIEHLATIAAAPHAAVIPVLDSGVVDMDGYKILLAEVKPELVSVMLVNSETGVLQPVKEMAQLAHDAGALFHTDAVQGAGRIDISLDNLGVDFMSLSGHKMAGPQGVGAIISKKGVNLPKFMLGGGQEKNCRAGTHNTAGIAGMGLAAAQALENLPHYAEIERLRDGMEQQMHEISSKITIYGSDAPRVGNTCNVGVAGLPAQTQMMALDLDGIAVSSGSACSSGAFKASHVLMAMGASEEDAKSALRISMGWATTSADIDRFLESWKKIVKRS